MNKVILMGRLTRDPDVRWSSQGDQSMAVARFTLAVDRRRPNQDGQREADFISCVAFGKIAEFAERYLHQGTKVAITGRIQTGSYTNKDGNKVYTTEVVIEEAEFAESLKSQGGNQQQPQQPQQYAQPSGNAAPQLAKRPQQEQYYQEQMPYMPQGRNYADPRITIQNDGFEKIPDNLDDEGLPFN